jgi:thioredoxin reductase (NADPH)
VTALHGGDTLDAVMLTSSAGVSVERDCRGLFCFIGAQPATEWLTGVAVDEDGFIRTDRDLTSDDLCGTWSLLGRAPLPYETSVPGVFAAGDVRSGSMKRVASAVGEGASAIRSVHLALAPSP